MKKSVVFLSALMAALLLFTACATAKSTSAVTAILADGEKAEKISFAYGTESPVLTAEFNGESDASVQWSSDDAGVVRVKQQEDGSCLLTALKPGKAKITVTVGDSSASVKVTVTKNQDNLTAKDTACSVSGEKFSVETMNIYYVEGYNAFLSIYGSYAAYFGIDTEAGVADLKNQSCDYSDDGTWWGYFLETAKEAVINTTALRGWATEQGIALTDEDIAAVDEQIETLRAQATENGFDNLDAYLQSLYGPGVTEEIYRSYLLNYSLSDKAYDTYEASLAYTDEEIAEYYATMGYEEANDYLLTAMRHILIMAEADENGEYTEEAIAAAHTKAEELYAQWLAGDATEDSFAELANANSEDPGSNTNGGLYENIYQDEMVEGINDWLFDASRQVGDTAVIDNNGSYVGTHVVYFTGYGEKYCDYLARTELLSTNLQDWLEGLCENYEFEEGKAYDSIGVF